MAAPIPILMYHSVAPAAPDGFRRWTVTPEVFTEHVVALQSEGYTGLTMSDALNRIEQGRSMPKRPVLVTFDDGFADFASTAMPILARYDVPATLYVTTGYLGATSRWLGPGPAGRIPMLTSGDLGSIGRSHVEVGAHSRSHAMLDLLPPSHLDGEVGEVRDELRQMTGQQVISFAYPHGYSKRVTRQAVASAGFTSAVSVHHSRSSGLEERYELPRIIVEDRTSAGRLLDMVQGRGLRSPQGRRWQEGLWRIRRAPWRGRHRQLSREAGVVERA